MKAISVAFLAIFTFGTANASTATISTADFFGKQAGKKILIKKGGDTVPTPKTEKKCPIWPICKDM